MLIAGSVAVKCAVPSRSGKWGPGDIDIFCTWDAAPMVRRRLFQRCGLICAGVVNNTSYNGAGPFLAGDVENRAAAVIHHVEEYAARPMNEDEYDNWKNSSWWRRQGLENAGGLEAYYKMAKQWGAEVMGPRSQWGPRAHWDPNIGKPGGALGGDFLFDYRASSFPCVRISVQLIIGRPEVKDATKLLRHFDIEICKCAFSASKVYIPAAVETLAGRTFITPERHALADSFMKALNQVKPTFPNGRHPTCPPTCTFAGSEMPKVLAKMEQKVWTGIGLSRYDGSQYDFEHKYTAIYKLFTRIQKYHRRGVKITNAPDGALNWDIIHLSQEGRLM